jgi:hypothetical protein
MNTGIEAADQMRRWHRTKKKGVKGMCLKYCRMAYGIPPKYPSAIKAWKGAKRKFTNPNLAPTGAAHFWEIGQFGHIAIQSRNHGKVWSTDAPHTDRIGEVNIAWFEKRWGAKYLGWTNEVNGKRIPLTELPDKKA